MQRLANVSVDLSALLNSSQPNKFWHHFNELSASCSLHGPTVWYSLSDDLCDPDDDSEHFRQDLKNTKFTGHFRALMH